MEEAIARVKFPAVEGTGGKDEEDEQEVTRAMVARQNRKGKKSGGFQSMGFSHPVFTGILKKGYRIPTPIQRKCIPLVMDGKDVVGMARTGSGKTAAFLLPMLEKLKVHSTKIGVRAIILAPTRELATQTFKFTKELGRFTSLKAALVLGGDSLEAQFSAMHANPDIIVATPGRFVHLIVEMDLALGAVEYVVFDEADRLFEMGFAEQLQDIIRQLPESRQTLLFSATLPRMLVEFAKAGLKDPVLVRLDLDSKLSDQLKLSFLSVRAEDKASSLLYLLQSVLPSSNQTVIFTATKHHVEYLKELLECAGISCTYVYSSLDQTARKINVAKFVHKKTNIMIVTDVAARGIDIPMLDNVVMYNFPDKPKLFVHRVGRVARAGRSGSAYLLVSPGELAYVLDLHLFLGHSLQIDNPDSSTSTSGVLGSIPQNLLDHGNSLIQQLHSSSSDLDDLKHVSENAQKQYLRSQGQPAPESVKRAKKLSYSIPIHPMFRSLCSTSELQQCQLLDTLRCYKPSQTIFEINSITATSSKQIMKSKRDLHSGTIVATIQDRRSQVKTTPIEPRVVKEEACLDNLMESFQTERSVRDEKRKSRKRKREEEGEEPHKKKRGGGRDPEHYLNYAPRDLHSEKGLSLGSGSFHLNADSAVLDMEADEQVTRGKSRNSMKWDRKRKKFVGASGDDPKEKRVKTESGHWIKASYKSNAYRDWKDKHKISTSLSGQGEEGEGGVVAGQRPRYRHKSRGQRDGGADLKPKAAILKKRQKKEAIAYQKQMKRKNKGVDSNSIGRGGAGSRKHTAHTNSIGRGGGGGAGSRKHTAHTSKHNSNNTKRKR